MLDTYSVVEEMDETRQWRSKIFDILIATFQSASVAFINVLALIMLETARYMVPRLADNLTQPRIHIASVPIPTRRIILLRLGICGLLCLATLSLLDECDAYAYLALSCWFSIILIVCSLSAVAFARLVRLTGTILRWIWHTYHDEIVMAILWAAVAFQRLGIQLSYNAPLMAAAFQSYIVRLWIYANWLWEWYIYWVMDR